LHFGGPRSIETRPQPHEGLGHTPSCDAGSQALNLHLEGGGGLLQRCQAWLARAWKPLGQADIILLHMEKEDQAGSLEVIPHLNKAMLHPCAYIQSQTTPNKHHSTAPPPTHPTTSPPHNPFPMGWVGSAFGLLWVGFGLLWCCFGVARVCFGFALGGVGVALGLLLFLLGLLWDGLVLLWGGFGLL